MKPRTFRRIILLGSVLGFIAIALVGYFVIRPMQRQRSIESTRIQGLQASEDGDYSNATKYLGQYLKRAEAPDPSLILTYARARYKVQTADGGYIRVATKSYREYLLKVPNDFEASQELLPLFNIQGMHLEAAELALKLRKEMGDESIQVLREEIIARQSLDSSDPQIEELLVLATSHVDTGFVDILTHISWLRSQDRLEEALTFIDQQLEIAPENPIIQVAGVWLNIIEEGSGDTQSPIELHVNEMCTIIGLDPLTNTWSSEPEFLSAELSAFLARFLNSINRHDLSLEVRLASARIAQDHPSLIWASRRLFWMKDFEKLALIDPMNADGEPVPDVVGYQLLANRVIKNQLPDQQEIEPKLTLQEISLDFRSKAWISFLNGYDLLNENKALEARPLFVKSLEKYPVEPTFLLYTGDMHQLQGRMNEAVQSWTLADEYTRSDVGSVGWIDPIMRSVDFYMSNSRFTEAKNEISKMSSRVDSSSLPVILSVYAQLARADALEQEDLISISELLTQLLGSVEISELAPIAPNIITLYAQGNEPDIARSLLRDLYQQELSPSILARLYESDSYYNLGIADELGITIDSLQAINPQLGLKLALSKARELNSVEKGYEFLDRFAQSASEETQFEWEFTKARYFDVFDDPRASELWENLRAIQPNNIQLLYTIAESEAFSDNPDGVQTIIDEIVEKTETVGKVIPSRLRLAHANAIVGQELNKSTRSQSIEMIRGVLASEQQNVQARNMLANLLALEPSPFLTPDQKFEPAYDESIEQFVIISRQLTGGDARPYMLKAIDLAIEWGSDDSALKLNREFESRFTDILSITSAAQRYIRLKEFEDAVRLFDLAYSGVQSPEIKANIGIELANLYLIENQRSKALEVFQDLRSMEKLTIDQLFELSSLYTKAGFQEEGDALSASGARYTLNPYDTKLAHARYAGVYLSEAQYLDALNELSEIEPTELEPWRLLIQHALIAQDRERAQEIVANAKVHLPDDDTLDGLSLLAQGKLESVSDLIKTKEDGTRDPQLVEAAKRMDEFMAAIDTQPREQLLKLLEGMLKDFPRLEPIQYAALTELNNLQVSAPDLSYFAQQAARSFPNSNRILEFASEASLRSGDPLQAIETANLWRANALGSPVFADSVSARAYLQLEEFDQAITHVQPYMLEAISNPDLEINTELIRIHSYAKLNSGEDPELTRARLEPLISLSNPIRTRVWLNLVITSIPTQDQAIHWLDIIEPFITDEEQRIYANTWVLVLERFNAPTTLNAQRSLSLMSAQVDSDSSTDPVSLGFLARSHAMHAQSYGDTNPTESQNEYKRATSILARADSLDPQNLGYLAQGSFYSSRANDYASAESMCRTLLTRLRGDSGFSASIKNNLAMSIEHQSQDPQRLNEALDLIDQAIAYENNSSYQGTKGWVLIGLEKYDLAETAFQAVIRAQPESLEGWVGMALVQHLLGLNSSGSIAKIQELNTQSRLPKDLRDRIVKMGQPEWEALFSDS